MKRIFLITLLLLIIVFSFGYSFLKVSAHSGDNSFFNRNLRDNFAQHRFLRNIFSLHYDGDGKSEYLGDNYQEIEVRILEMYGEEFSEEVLEVFVKKISQLTGKSVKYKYIEIFQYQEEFTLEELTEKIIRIKNPTEKGILYVISASKMKDEHQRLGSTLKENGIVFFKETMNNNPFYTTDEDIFRYSVSLLMHEFGHQLGLGHNEKPSCLMNPVTEFTNKRNKGIIDDFCQYERRQIEDSKSLLMKN